MKRIWVALTLMVICISFAIVEFIVIKNKVDYFVDSINLSYNYFSQREYKTATQLLEHSSEQWSDSEKTLNLFLSHDKVDEIEESLSELSNYAENKEKSHFQATFEKTKRQLLCLKQSELPNLENIM